MKKTILILTAGAILAGSAIAQDSNTNNNISTTTTRRNTLPPITPEQSEGGLQRGVRLGNPVQMFNPLAPYRYGRGTDFSVQQEGHDQAQRPHDRSRTYVSGVRLFSFTF